MFFKKNMFKKAVIIGLGVFLLVTPLAIIFLALSYSEVGMAKDIDIPGTGHIDYSSIPPSVINDAVELAAQLVGKGQQKMQGLVDELMAMYVEARDKDVLVIFNSGGWGWSRTEPGKGWATILDGIRAELQNMGYSATVVSYRRTSHDFRGYIKEFIEAVRRYPHKARELAMRVQFLTDHLPDLKVIVAGESTGTVITDRTMAFLKDRDGVYSIQTGMPFWNKPVTVERTLLVNSNGRGIDTFSRGNIPAMIWASIKSWLGLSSPDDNPGDILRWLKAPGHDYSWQYPGVYNEVVNFLKQNFGQKGP